MCSRWRVQGQGFAHANLRVQTQGQAEPQTAGGREGQMEPQPPDQTSSGVRMAPARAVGVSADGGAGQAARGPTSRRRKQCTVMMTKPCTELKTAKRTWKRMERRSVMASTADIQVSASRGRTTQELHSDALGGEREGRG